MSQADEVLQMLRDAGARGVHTFQIYGAFIANPSQRIADLTERGHEISSFKERPAPDRAMGARYTLVKDVEVGSRPIAGEKTSVSPPTESTADLDGPNEPSTVRTPHPTPVSADAGAGRPDCHGQAASASLFDITPYVPRGNHYTGEAA